MEMPARKQSPGARVLLTIPTVPCLVGAEAREQFKTKAESLVSTSYLSLKTDFSYLLICGPKCQNKLSAKEHTIH
jgi:hypothetical protein